MRKEAERLKKQGVNILIAVGHAGFIKDQEIAENVPDIDVVVGGHTNTFLWTGMKVKMPSNREIKLAEGILINLQVQSLLLRNHKGLIRPWLNNHQAR